MRTAPTFAGVGKALVRPALWFCASNLLVAALSAQCSNPTLVTQQTVNGNPNVRDNNALATSGVININGSASVTFVAGNCIELGPGFRATAGTAPTTFHAWVETAPSAVSVSPPSGSGASYPFTWTVSSPSGYSNLLEMQAIFNTSGSGVNGCYIQYLQGANLLKVADINGTHWSNGVMPGSSDTTGNFNPYCTINGFGSGFSVLGTQLSVTASITFQPAFAGPKNDYLIAYDNEGLNSTWQPMGTWTVPAPPCTYSISPSGQSFTSSGGSGTVSVTAGAGCSWTAVSNAAWITITGGASGSGNGTVSYSVTANTGTARSGTMTIAGQTFTVSQAAAPLTVTCSATPTPAPVGQTVTFSAIVSGGSPPYTYSWSGAVSGSDQSVSFVPGEAGGYQASVTVNQMVTASCLTAVADPVLAAFRECIGPNGIGATCQLAPGTYVVPPPFYDSYGQPQSYLQVRRSGITVTGTMVSGPGDTVLRRGRWLGTAGPPPPNAEFIMQASSSLTGVTISYFTFDGNRYGAGLGCLDGNASYWDLQAVGGVTVQWVDFINAPGTALALGGNATVSLSNFGQGGNGIGPSLVSGPESPAETATRSTAIWIDGSDNGAWYNAIAFAGTAGITLNGSGQYAYGNLLYQNRYELSDVQRDQSQCEGVPAPCLQQGGQLVVFPAARNASVAGNVIDGNTWPYGPGGPGTSGPPYAPLATGCTLGNGSAFNYGIEALGIGHGFYNNEVYQHTGSGMMLAATGNPAEHTGQIYISSSNPWDSSDSIRLIEGNAFDGITFCGPSTNPACVSPAVGVTLDAVLAENNAGYGVSLANVSNYFGPPDYLGFINAAGYRGACLTGNTRGGTDPHANTTLQYPVPLNDADFHGNPCPTSGVQTPALSHIPGWRW